jgi:hypothetical protein
MTSTPRRTAVYLTPCWKCRKPSIGIVAGFAYCSIKHIPTLVEMTR